MNAPNAERSTPTVILRDKGVVTIPLALRTEAGIQTGDTLMVTIDGRGRIVLTPASVKVVPRDHTDTEES